MADFGTVQLPSVQQGLQNYVQFPLVQAQTDATQIANQGAQQTLADRATLRGLSSDLASPDATVQRQASATAATLPHAEGDRVVSAINAMNGDQRQGLAQRLALTSQMAGAALAMPQAQRPQFYQDTILPMARQAGITNLPAQYPGDDVVNGHRVMALSTQGYIDALGAGQVPANSRDTTLNTPAPPGTPIVGTQPQAGGAGTPASVEQFGRQLAGAEGKPGSVNAQGFSGQYQFGTARLADLGMYKPAAGENLAANQWQGTLSIPGFPNVKTQADFLASPAAQQAAFGAHTAGIDRTIAQTPGAAALDRNGLRAVAHLGGEAGMQKFVQSGGRYDPEDANHTRLSDYYRRFSTPGGAAPAQAAAPGAPAPLQVAGPGAPTGGSAPRVMADLRAGQAAPPAGPAPMSSYVAPGGQPQSTLAPLAAPSPAPAFTPTRRLDGKPQPSPVPGTVLGVGPNGQQAVGVMPGTPPVVAHNRDGTISLLDPASHQSVGSVQAPDVETLLHGNPATPEYAAAYSRVGAGKEGQDGRMIQPDMRPYRPPSGAAAGNGAAAPGTPTITNQFVKEDYDKGAKEVQGIADAGQQAQASQVRLNLMRDLAARIASGAGGTSRAEWTNFAQTYMPALSPAFVKAITGIPDAAIPQEFAKLALQSAGTQERGVLGSRGGYQAMRLFQSANPGLDLRSDANRRILNMQLVGAQADADYAQGAMQHHNQQLPAVRAGQGYTPLAQFDQQWQAQRNPQAYAAAIGVMNGDPVEKVFMGLRPDEQARAIAIAQRADPGAKPSISGDAGFHLLPSGTVFTGPDKKTRTKP